MVGKLPFISGKFDDQSLLRYSLKSYYTICKTKTSSQEPTYILKYLYIEEELLYYSFLHLYLKTLTLTNFKSKVQFCVECAYFSNCGYILNFQVQYLTSNLKNFACYLKLSAEKKGSANCKLQTKYAKGTKVFFAISRML